MKKTEVIVRVGNRVKDEYITADYVYNRSLYTPVLVVYQTP